MTTKERKLLQRLMIVCNKLGCSVDLTAVNTFKLYDRQRAHELVSNVLYGILVQHSENEYAEEDMNKALYSLEKLESLVDKEYPDKNGY